MNDPRFGGVSGIALDRGRLLAVTDSGVLVSLPKPGQGRLASLHDLPAGPGTPHQKRGRDSEAIARTPGGDWWIAFENRHSLLRFDHAFSRALGKIDLSPMGWGLNRGVEALLGLPSGDLLILSESDREVIRVGRRGMQVSRLEQASGGIADAALLPDGRAVLLVRELVPLGIRNRLAFLARTRSGYRLRPSHTIAVGPLTNLEAITAEPLPSGATRLWIMSDNDFSIWRRTILLAIDLPKKN